MLLVHTMEEFYEEKIAMLVAIFALVIQIFNIIVMINVLVSGYYHTSIRNKKRKRSKLFSHSMLGHAGSGFDWDNVNKCVTCELDVWNGWIKVS